MIFVVIPSQELRDAPQIMRVLALLRHGTEIVIPLRLSSLLGSRSLWSLNASSTRSSLWLVLALWAAGSLSASYASATVCYY